MFLIVGLGNPGEQFTHTRHNAGRETVEAFRKKFMLPDFRFEKKWNAEIVEGSIHKEKIILFLPDTFMNKSGAAIAPAARFFKIKPNNIVVIHDDADIILGRAKLSFAKHSAGHKGVESVIRTLNTNKFWRFRIGIAGKREVPAEKLVLKKCTPEEMRTMKKIMRNTIKAIEIIIQKSPEYAMNDYNKN